MDIPVNHNKISLQVGDITQCSVEAIVNAANRTLSGGGGVDGAIHRAAGGELLLACRQLGGCPTGEARITSGFDLPARWVIHTVGPVYKNGRSGEEEMLISAYRSSLILAAERHIESIAFPAISSGVYGYPMSDAAAISMKTIADFLKGDSSIKKVIIILYNQNYYELYKRIAQELFFK